MRADDRRITQVWQEPKSREFLDMEADVQRLREERDDYRERLFVTRIFAGAMVVVVLTLVVVLCWITQG